MYPPQDACSIALRCAGKADEGWNKRFVSMLNILGYQLEPFRGQLAHIDDMLAPEPVKEGWQYHYPSVIVAKSRIPYVEHDSQE